MWETVAPRRIPRCLENCDKSGGLGEIGLHVKNLKNLRCLFDIHFQLTNINKGH